MKRIVFVAVLLLTVATVPALATITVTPTPIISGTGPYTWTYSATLTGLSSIDTGDFFTIVDFAGFQAGSQSVVANWTASSSNTGMCPTGTGGVFATCLGMDNAAVPNLTWVYNGPTVSNATPTTVTSLGNFSAVSTFNLPVNEEFFSQDNDLQTGSQNEAATGGTNVPSPTTVAEPGSLLLLGTGLLGFAVLGRRKVVEN
jgi:hypothetical protein